jgi:hypothetical protein
MIGNASIVSKIGNYTGEKVREGESTGCLKRGETS